jgi:hypothetical protein
MITLPPYIYEKDSYSLLPQDMKRWMNKLRLAEELGYVCGPCGMDAPIGEYCVRPMMNLYGQGEGGFYKQTVVDRATRRITNRPGYFWVEWFSGVTKFTEYINDVPLVTHEATVDQTASRRAYAESANHIAIPAFLLGLSRYLMIEAHGDKIIEVSFRLAGPWARRDVIADYQAIDPAYDPTSDVSFGITEGRKIPGIAYDARGEFWEVDESTRVDSGQ